MKWYIRQLLPLRYDCHGYSHTERQPFHVHWRMWFGRCFGIRWHWATPEGWGG